MEKITLIKTNIISKVIHLLTVLPTPPNFLKLVNDLLFGFLWDDKPDKIKRITTCKDYFEGGLKMIDIYSFEKSLKINWLKRKFLQPNTQWSTLFHEMYGSLDRVYKLGGEWAISKKIAFENKFWKSVFEGWSKFCKSKTPRNNFEILQSCIWYNTQLSGEPLFFPKWYNKGISLIGDIVESTGDIMTLQKIEKTFGLKINFLEYHRVNTLVNKFIAKYKKNGNFHIQRPYVPLSIRQFLLPEKGCKIYYRILFNNCKNVELPMRNKWENMLSKHDDEAWKNVFHSCFKSIKDSIIWFQYRIIFGILPTRYFLRKIKSTESDVCVFCKDQKETIFHLFCHCSKVIPIWQNIESWISNKVGIKLRITDSMKILGYIERNKDYWPINFVILVTKKYIYWCSKKGFMLNIYFLQKEIRKIFDEQRALAKVNLNETSFMNMWDHWINIFNIV